MTRRTLFNTLRVVVCVLALWFVARSVTLDDRIALVDGDIVAGRVVEVDPVVRIERAGGEEQVLAPEQVARDADGSIKITYGLKTAWRASAKRLLLLALAIAFPVALLQAERLRWLLRAQGIKTSYWICAKLTFAGNFLNFAAPIGSTAGDVFKAYFVSLHTPRKTEAMTTIVLDRVVGLATVTIAVSLLVLLAPDRGRIALFKPYIFGALFAGAFALVAYTSPFLRSRIPWRRWLARLPGLDQIRRIDRATRQLISRRGILAYSMLLTVGLQILALTSFFVIALALRLDATPANMAEFYTYFFVGAVVQALPGPPQGLGTVELVYQYLFAPFGSASTILIMAFAIRVVVLVCALPGVLVTATASYKPAEPVPETQGS